MAAVVEVKYFNTFLLKKLSKDNNDFQPVYNGSSGIPQNIGGYPVYSNTVNDYNASIWAIEESRIQGGYNNTSTDLGVRAYLIEDEPKGFRRGSALIYSGIFNSRTGINETNVFSIGEEIEKGLDPSNGSIQKLYAEDTNLIIFQENKVNRALIDKDAIYTAEGGSASVSQLNLVIGQIVPYAGEFGISRDPQSFAVYGYRKYFTDKDRNAVIRLSRDGITEISNYGMYDYFREEFETIDDTTGEGIILGGWDIHSKQYIVNTKFSLISANANFKTLSYDENVRGWPSFYDYNPDQIISLRNKMYTAKENKLWQHYSEGVNRGSFYGTDYKSDITFIFNPNVSLQKNFLTVNYEGTNGWEITSFKSDQTGKDLSDGYKFYNDSTNEVLSYYEGEYVLNPANGQPVTRANYQATFGTTRPPYPRNHAGFDRKENKYTANLVNSSPAMPGEIRFGNQMSGIKAFFATVNISTDSTTNVGGFKELFAVSSNYVESSY